MLGYGSCGNGGRVENENENEHSDRELLARTIATLAQAGTSLGNLVAKQAVQGLESLLQMGKGNCPRKQPEGRGNGDGEGEESSLANPYAKIVVPYVGVITISPGEYYSAIEAAVDEAAETQLQTGMHTQNQTQSHGAPFSFSLERNHDHNHEEWRNGGSYHDHINTRYEDTGMLGQEAREVLVDAQGQRQIQMEWTSIDFDWASNLTAGFEDDWAWLNGLGG